MKFRKTPKKSFFFGFGQKIKLIWTKKNKKKIENKTKKHELVILNRKNKIFL